MRSLVIYTDGSHFKTKIGSGRLGIGGVLIDDSNKRRLDQFSEEINEDYLIKTLKTSYVSNPTMELLAVLKALQYFKDSIDQDDIITLKADYIGVSKWLNGEWRIKEPYIAKINNEIQKEIKDQKLKGRINFAWVKGHQKLSVSDPDTYWNNYVDKLAKGEIK